MYELKIFWMAMVAMATVEEPGYEAAKSVFQGVVVNNTLPGEDANFAINYIWNDTICASLRQNVRETEENLNRWVRNMNEHIGKSCR